MAKKPSWGLIILGSAVFIVVVGVGLVVVAGFVIYKQFAFQATTTTSMSASDEFSRVAAEFEGQKPLLEIRDGDPVLSKERPKATRAAAPIEALHIMVWKADEKKLLRLNIPFWLLRMTNGKPIRIGGHRGDIDDEPVHLNITAEDLQGYGPGLVLDHKESGGDRVLVWARQPRP